MTNFNKVILLGRVGNDPELKTSSNGKPYMMLSIATHAFKRGAAGENPGAEHATHQTVVARHATYQSDWATNPLGDPQRVTHWHRVVVFGVQAENCATYLKRGSPVLVEGSLEVSHYIDKNENKATSVSVIGHTIQFLGGYQSADVESSRATCDLSNSSRATCDLSNSSRTPFDLSNGSRTRQDVLRSDCEAPCDLSAAAA